MKLQHYKKISMILGRLCLMFTIIFIPPIMISLIYHDGMLIDFVDPLCITLIIGILLWLPFKSDEVVIYRRHGFLIIVLVWLVLSFVASIPFILVMHLSVIDSLFEAVSGITTTGATVLSNLDMMPPSLLFYRQELQWFGGMGLIVLAIAIIPRLGTGGMSIYKAEVPGVMKDDKLMPRISQTAKLLWKIYLALTICCAIAYWMAGMSLYDAIAHSMSTVSTGGFSTHDQSLNYFHSAIIEWIAIVFMLMGAINFSLHFIALKKKNINGYFLDIEVRLFLAIIASVILVITFMLGYADHFKHIFRNMLDSSFTTVSMITSTGFVTTDYSIWPLFVPFLLILIGFIGGCGGSTAGGMKVIRMLILLKLVNREVKYLLHPKGIFHIRLNDRRKFPEQALQSVFGFFALYVASFIVLLLLMIMAGHDQVTAFSAIATCMNNMGPGLGEVTQSFAGLDDSAKIISVVSMLLGRLEVVSVLVLFSPTYWKS